MIWFQMVREKQRSQTDFFLLYFALLILSSIIEA